MGAILSLVTDDAFYYFKIAKNIVEGNGCSFDGIARTNGFHPLWLLCMTLVYWIANFDLTTPILVMLVLNYLICVFTFTLLFRLVEDYIAPGYGVVAVAVCLLPNVLTAMINGLETSIEIMAVVILIWLVYRNNILDAFASRKSAFLLGIILGLIALCRLDTAFIFLAAVGMTLVSIFALRVPFKRGFGRLFIICVGFGLVVAPYFIWNLVMFGHVTPISGAVKSTFPSISINVFSWRGDKRFGAVMLAVSITLLAIAFFKDRSRSRNWSDTLNSPLLLLAIGLGLHYAHVSLFLQWGVNWWHFAAYGPLLALAIAKFAHRVTGTHLWMRRITITVLVLPMLVLSVYTNTRFIRIKGEQHRGWLEAATWARENTPPDAVFAAMDAGLFGYFSERSVINLDGKANGYDYLRSLREGTVSEYLVCANTSYVAHKGSIYRGERSILWIPRVNQLPVGLHIPKENEVFRGSEIPSYVGRTGDAPRTNFYIWKFEPIPPESSE
jgi:hypothetical protein